MEYLYYAIIYLVLLNVIATYRLLKSNGNKDIGNSSSGYQADFDSSGGGF